MAENIASATGTFHTVIPLIGGRSVSVWLPRPMSREEWKRFRLMLRVMKPGLLEKEGQGAS